MKVLVIGASGMLGSTVLRVLSEKKDWQVFGTVRDEGVKQFFSESIGKRIRAGVDVEQQHSLIKILDQMRPDVVINCTGLTKHKMKIDDLLVSVPINALVPHQMAEFCKLMSVRLIHVSTDCVFSGERGGYVEGDPTDARDAYGKSKALGEVDYSHAITLRTSIIGHELQSKISLLDWFLSQRVSCKGYTRAIFSGLPTVIFAQIIRDAVIPHKELSGLYHVAAKPISKFNLLKLIADVYGKVINIEPDDTLVVDRSLDATRFFQATGYIVPEWPELVRAMHSFV